MTYLVIGKDHKDAEAQDRRLAQRAAHLEGAKQMKADGKLLYAVAMIEDGKMIGSMMVFNFETEEELNQWKATEPYITGNVWKTVEITQGAVAPIFS